MPRKATRVDVWAVHCAGLGHHAWPRCERYLCNPTMWWLALPGKKRCLTQSCGPGKTIAMRIGLLDWPVHFLPPNIPCMGFGRHKATVPAGLERNPYCDTIMCFQAVEVEMDKESIFLRQGKIHNHWMSYLYLLLSLQIKFSAPLTSEMHFIYDR